MLNEVMRATFEGLGVHLRALAPRLLAMLLLLLGGLVVAGACRVGLGFLLPRLGVDRFAERSGLRALAARGGMTRPVSALLALSAAWVALTVFVLLAVAALDIVVARELVTRAFSWLPHLLVAVALGMAGGLLAGFVRRSVLIGAVNAGLASARLIAAGAYTAVLVLFGAMALEQIGLGTRVVLIAFAILFGGVVLALALAFGLAGRDLAHEALHGLVRQGRQHEDDGLKHI